MAKTKKVKVKVEEPIIEENSVPDVSPQQPGIFGRKYEGAVIEDILQENDTAFLCKMSDGTTKWIPKENLKS